MTNDSLTKENRIKADLNKIYNQLQVNQNMRASLITYVSGLDVDHRNLYFIAAAISIAYNMHINNLKLTKDIFVMFSNPYSDSLLSVFGVSKSDVNVNLKNKIKAELLNYVIYVCKNISDFHGIIEP